MNAIEIADTLEETYGYPTQASDMLRRQHEAIKVLREALQNVTSNEDSCTWRLDAAIKALTDTEEI